MAFQKSLCFFLVFFIASFSSSQANTFNVGGKDGWTLHPSENYNQWSGRLRFLTNDTLHFKYDKASDSVLVVNKGDYDTCNTNSPITRLDGGDSYFTLGRSGPFYFISGNTSNCDQGQKLIVVVLSPRNRPPPTTPLAPPPAATAPSPSTVLPSPPAVSPASAPSSSTVPPASAPSSSTVPPASAPSSSTVPPASAPSSSTISPTLSPAASPFAMTPSPSGTPMSGPPASSPGGGGVNAPSPGGGGGGGSALSPGGSNPADVNAPPPQGSGPALTSTASLVMISLVMGMVYY